jgi:hypothetical protein
MRPSRLDAQTIKQQREAYTELNRRFAAKAALCTAQRAEIMRLRRELARLQRHEGKARG